MVIQEHQIWLQVFFCGHVSHNMFIDGSEEEIYEVSRIASNNVSTEQYSNSTSTDSKTLH